MSMKDDFLNLDDLKIEPIEVCGKQFYIKVLNGTQRLELERGISKDVKNDGDLMTRVACACLCDEAGNLLFNYPDDIPVINEKSAGATIAKVFFQALKLNGMTKQDVDDLVKN